MDRCPANYSLLAWLPGNAASRISLVSAVKLLLLITVDQLDPEAKGLPGPTHGWPLTQSNTNDPTNWFFRVWETGLQPSHVDPCCCPP